MTTQGENAIKRKKEGKLETEDHRKGEKRSVEDDTIIKKKKLKKEKQIQDNTVVDENSRSEENTNDNKGLMKKKKKKKLIKDDLLIEKYKESITNQPTKENIKTLKELVKKKKKEKEGGDDSLTHENNDGHINESITLRKLKKNKRKNRDKTTAKTSGENDMDQIKEIENEDIENEGEKEETKKKEPSKRQIKKEKALLREEQAKEENKKENAKRALNYISKWKHAKSEWKFEKLKQIWLMDNLLNDKYVSDEHFPFILEYFEGCKGIAKKTLIEKAMKVIKKIEDNIEENEEIIQTTEYKRARQLLQALPVEI